MHFKDKKADNAFRKIYIIKCENLYPRLICVGLVYKSFETVFNHIVGVMKGWTLMIKSPIYSLNLSYNLI